MSSSQHSEVVQAAGSLDGVGAGDHDRVFLFRRPRVSAPFPFSTRQYARLLVLRGAVQAGERHDGQNLPAAA
jgi:hypothetical protein